MTYNHSDKQTALTLVIDQGSHASRLAIFDATGQLIQLNSCPLNTQINGQHIEQDPVKILHSIRKLLNGVSADHRQQLQSAGLCTQRSTIVAWNTLTGEALSPAISWRDLRAQSSVEKLRPQQQRIRQLSGLPLSGHYSASKMRWLVEHNIEVARALKQGHLCIAPLASYLLFHLLREQPVKIDHSNAQRSQLLDVNSLNWSAELLESFHIDEQLLPELCPVQHLYGHLKIINTPLNTVCGDQNAAVYAYPGLTNTDCLINMGTGAFLLTPCAEASTHPRLLRTIASSHQATAEYLTEGTVNGAGAAISWMLENDKASQALTETALFEKLPGWLEETTHPPLFINTVAGLGSPCWCTRITPGFITPGEHSLKEKYTAVIESIVFLLFYNLQQLQSLPEKIYMGGGLSQLDGLCQKLATLSQARVIRSQITEMTARGCACLSQREATQHAHSLPIPVSDTFKPQQDSPFIKRYQHFVGELEKRCNSN